MEGLGGHLWVSFIVNLFFFFVALGMEMSGSGGSFELGALRCTV